MNFGEALQELQKGSLVSRKGWNGKDMFLFAREACVMPYSEIPYIKSIPLNVRNYYARKTSTIPPELQMQRQHINLTAHIAMKAADDSIVNGWLASQTDMFADDWYVYEDSANCRPHERNM